MLLATRHLNHLMNLTQQKRLLANVQAMIASVRSKSVRRSVLRKAKKGKRSARTFEEDYKLVSHAISSSVKVGRT